jgi:hypothetical protein
MILIITAAIAGGNMKKTIEIVASFTGTISTGSYENEKPFFSIKEIIEPSSIDGGNETFQELITDDFIKNRQNELKQICVDQFAQQAEVAYKEKLAKTYRNIRWYPVEGLGKVPSVTSIISWDADFYMSPDELAQYSSRGTIIHKQVEILLRDNVWKEAKDIPEIYPDLVIVSRGNLGLEIDNVDFRGFYKDYPFKVIALEETVINKERRYGGRIDILCIIEKKNPGKWNKIDGILYDVPTILDVKTGSIDKTKCFKQQTAYWHCREDVQQVGIVPLTKDNKCGYAKPLILTDKEKYWHLFLKDQDNFNQRYGL